MTRQPSAVASLAGPLAGLALLQAVRALASTLRAELVGPEPDPARPHLHAFLHGGQLPLLRYPRRGELVVLSSLSADGELQARVLTALGFTVVRGSSSRGGAEGLAAVVRALRRGADAAVAVDGPRGPAGKVKPGALFAARASGALVVPVAAAAAPRLVLERSWDRFEVPAPWARVVVARGEAFEVPRAGGAAALERARERLESALGRLGAEARAAAAVPARGAAR